MLRAIKLLILLFIFSSQYLNAGDYINDAQDGLPKAQYEYAMSLIEKGKKNIALDWFTIAAAQGHLKSSLWIEQNIDYRKDEFITALIATNEELKDKVKSYTFDELEEIKKR